MESRFVMTWVENKELAYLETFPDVSSKRCICYRLKMKKRRIWKLPPRFQVSSVFLWVEGEKDAFLKPFIKISIKLCIFYKLKMKKRCL